MRRDGSGGRLQRRDRLGWSALVVWLALMCAAAQAVHVDDNRAVGAGPDSFQVAVIADPHNVYPNLQAAVDSINARVSGGIGRIQMVIVDGDLMSWGAGELDVTRSILDQLAVPYVPLPGNHDVIPHDVDPLDENGMFTTRCFNRTFDSVYAALELQSVPPIQGFTRYRRHPWNFQMIWDTFVGYDVFQNCAFRAGPNGSPYLFLCLDFNSRVHAAAQGGAMPDANIYELPFNDVTSSIAIQGNPLLCSCIVYDGVNYTGDSYTFHATESTLVPLGWNDRVSSIKTFGCAVTLYASVSLQGNQRLSLYPPNDCDPDLRVNGADQWWRDYLSAYCDTLSTHKDNVFIFAHHPLIYNGPPLENRVGGDPPNTSNLYLDMLSFDGYEYMNVTGFLAPYTRDIGGWFSGHLDDTVWWHLPFETRHGRVYWPVYGANRICDWWVVPTCSEYGGVVRILTFHFSEQPGFAPCVDVDGSGPEDDVVDVTREDSIPIAVKTLNQLCQLTVRILNDGECIRTLATDSSFSPNDSVTLWWDGRNNVGSLALPGDGYSVRYYTSTGVFMGSSSFIVKGTEVPVTIAASDTWDTLFEPYVLAGHGCLT